MHAELFLSGQAKMNHRVKLAVVLCTLVILCAFLADVFAQQLPVVTAIEVKGLRRIEEGGVRSKLSQKVGEPLSQETTTEDITALYKLGYFEDVKVEIDPYEGGVKVVYLVSEKPTVVKVDFQGNTQIEDTKLKEIITLTPGAIADVTLINDNAVKVKAHYEDEGYYLAKVVPVVRRISASDVAVTYQITEGTRVKIKDIEIQGNRALSSRQIRKVMKTSTRGFLSFVTGSGYYKKEVMKADIERVRDLYYNNGYLKVAVAEPKLDLIDNGQAMRISLLISEGDQFKVSSVSVEGVRAYGEQEILQLIKLKAGTVFSKQTLQKDVAALTDKYSNNGYALVTVSPDIVPDEASKSAGVTYRIEEGDRFRMGKIDISGNTKTRDKVIRREVRLDEGEIFNASALKRSYERLNNLQYFETIDFTPKPRADEKLVDLDIKVKEKSTGFLSIGGGYSSVDGPIGMVDITQGNLFGRGQYIKIRGELGGESSFYELAFRDPWFLDKPLMFSASIYDTARDYGDFEKEAQGFLVSLGKNFWEYWSGAVAYNYEKADVSNIADDASDIIKDQEGTSTTSALNFTVTRDTRDNTLDPMRGSRNSSYITFAGLGGSNAFLKAYFDTSWFFPLFDVTSFHVRGRFGYSTGLFGKEVPIYERYYVGGIYTVRGIDFGDAGPKDVNDEPIGGVTELILNFEYIFPIISEYRLKGLVFVDAGTSYAKGETYGSNLTYTTGPEIRWLSPMGPIRVSWGFNLSRKPGQATSKVEFAFGSVF